MTTFALLTHRDRHALMAVGVGPSSSVSVAQFLADAAQLAAALPSGQHILNVCGDRYRFAVGLAAALLSDKVSLLPPTLTPEMVRQVKHFAPDVFCLADQAQSLDMLQVSWAELMVSSPAPQLSAHIPELPASQLAVIVFTSGSTGVPLAHRKTWGEVVRSVRGEAERLGLLDGRQHSLVATVPPQHMFGFESSVLLALQSGGILSAAHPFYPADICSALACAPQPRMLVTTPIHLKVLLASGLDIPPLEQVLSATAPLSPQLALEAEARLQVPLIEIYGATETGQIASRRTTQTSEWTLFPGVQLSLADGHAQACGGHLERTIVLSDELELLDDTRFLLHGRTSDLVNIAGKRSSLGYLNYQLNAIPGVEDGAFFMPDQHGDRVTRLMAFVVAPSLTASALITALRERIDTVFIPRPLVFLETLPRNSTGKVVLATLTTLAQEHSKGRSGEL